MFGTPMGSPISPLFADIVMNDLENNCLRIVIFYYGFVDDTILCVQKKYIGLVINIVRSNWSNSF